MSAEGWPELANALSAPEFVFVANFRYQPNVEGVEWLLEQVVPLLRSKLPACRVVLAGKCDEDLYAYGAQHGIDVTGPFDLLEEVLHRDSISIVPLLGGTGTRLKILEAWSLGVPVVSTTVGAAGLGVTDGEDVLIGDRPSAFAEACARLAGDPGLRDNLAVRGRERVEEYRWARIGTQMQARVRRVLRNTLSVTAPRSR